MSNSEVAAKLFSRAPQEYLESRTLDELAHITSCASKLLEEYFQNSETVLIQSESFKRHTGLYIILGDCPFIVNTINETLRDLEQNIQVFLHPILIAAGKRVSEMKAPSKASIF